MTSLPASPNALGRRNPPLFPSLRLGVLALLLVAYSLRVFDLGGQSLWYDEAVTADVTARGLEALTRWTANDIQPPLYYYFVAGWSRLAGRTEWALRWPSVAAGMLALALMWSVARRLFRGMPARRRAPWIALALGTISAPWVYFAQEARMYALLVALGLAAAYALLRASADEGTRWWAAFVVSATALLYTHYFGGFLLAAYAVAYLAAGGRAFKARLVRIGLALAAVFLLYLPWLPATLDRYRTDRSYWPGELKLGEALRHLAVQVTTGAPEMMLEPDAARLLPLFGLALLSSGAAMIAAGRRERRVALLLALVWTAPVACVLLLASQLPKFNPRYLLLVSPAYLLLLAGGSAVLLGSRSSSAGPVRLAARVVAIALIALPALVSVRALNNWFSDPAFTKAQWREAATAVRSAITPGEAVVLVSGHASPAWDYYAPDLPPIRVPDVDVLDVAAVQDFDLGVRLGPALAGKPGVWLVLWQDEVVDPMGIAAKLLGSAGRESEAPGAYWHVGLRHWQFEQPVEIQAAAAPQHLEGVNFDHKVMLLGWDDPADGSIDVYWRALNTLPADYQISLILEDASGAEVGRWDGRPAGYDYPASRWNVGEDVFGRYPLPLAPGYPPGAYTLSIAVYDPDRPEGLDIRDAADNPAGKRVRLQITL